MTITNCPSSESPEEDLSLFGYFLKCFKKYATFKGRARRKEYWGFVLFIYLFSWSISLFLSLIIIINMLLENVMIEVLYMFGPALAILFWLLLLASIPPYLAVLVRRLHDHNISGWGVLITFIPIVGGIYMLVITCTRGTAGENRFGSDPKALLKNL
jgi:uncharacterized membrane protein YhaH (DUF805 family)